MQSGILLVVAFLIVMLSLVMLNVTKLSGIILVVAFFIVMLSVVMLNAFMLKSLC
jgi:hypothetical protein